MRHGGEPDRRPLAVGSTLVDARQRMGWDATEAARASGLPPETVATLEGADPGEWAADSHTLASLRIYARTLRLDPEPMVTEAWRQGQARGGARPAVTPMVPGPNYPHRTPRHRRWLVAAAALVPAVVVTVLVIVFAFTGDGRLGLVTDATSRPTDTDGDDAETEEGEADTDGAPDGDDTAEQAAEPDEDAAPADPQDADDTLPGRAPEETPVQVLDALRDPEATERAAEELATLGYEVVLVDTTRDPWPETGVYFEDGWETEAESLETRDSRFPVGGPNQSFVDEAGLHVVIGSDWDD